MENKFPELDQLELEKLRKEVSQLRSKVESYEQILKDNDLLDAVPTASDVELLCINQLSKYKKATDAGAVLSLEEVKIVDILHKQVLLARGKAVPDEGKKKGKKKEEKQDLGKLLAIAGEKIEE
jgi:hypothetical protein